MNQVANIKSRLPMPEGLTDIDAGKWRVLVESIFPSAKTVEAVVMALDYCKVRNLDPFKRPVNIVPMYNKTLKKEVETVWPGINSVQVDAARTQEWAGMDAPVWGADITEVFKGAGNYKDDDGNWSKESMEVSVTYPESCSLTVYRTVKGQKCAFTETVFWKETFSSIGKTGVPNHIWQKRARGQLHKCAKAAVLRTAFPEAGEYTAEEMEGKEIAAGGVVIENTPQKITPYSGDTTPREAGYASGASWGRKLDDIERLWTLCVTVEDLEKVRLDNKAHLDATKEIDAECYADLERKYKQFYKKLAKTKPTEKVAPYIQKEWDETEAMGLDKQLDF